MAEQSSNEPKEAPSKRYATKELAQIEVYGRMGKIVCRMSNLSESGAFLEVVSSNYLPRQKDLVRVTVNLRQLNKTHVVDAEVVWSKGLGIGLHFLKKDILMEKLTGRLSAA